VAISSSEVSAAACELAVGAQGMSVAAGQVSNQCAVAAGDASSAGRLATSGGRSIQQASAEIARIDEFVTTSTTSVRTLADRGRQIARVVELIEDISDRTHLVALNASIEASKAGPSGRAFAVLADEVRRLAERAQKAAEECSATVRGVQDDCSAAADRMSFGAAQIKQSADFTGRAGHDLAEIIRTASGVSSMIQTISLAAEEAGAGAAQSAGAAAQLSTRAGDLKAMVDRFRIDTTSFMPTTRPG
jgi:methyl-accepting chemotaxis protein